MLKPSLILIASGHSPTIVSTHASYISRHRSKLRNCLTIYQMLRRTHSSTPVPLVPRILELFVAKFIGFFTWPVAIGCQDSSPQAFFCFNVFTMHCRALLGLKHGVEGLFTSLFSVSNVYSVVIGVTESFQLSPSCSAYILPCSSFGFYFPFSCIFARLSVWSGHLCFSSALFGSRLFPPSRIIL